MLVFGPHHSGTNAVVGYLGRFFDVNVYPASEQTTPRLTDVAFWASALETHEAVAKHSAQYTRRCGVMHG